MGHNGIWILTDEGNLILLSDETLTETDKKRLNERALIFTPIRESVVQLSAGARGYLSYGLSEDGKIFALMTSNHYLTDLPQNGVKDYNVNAQYAEILYRTLFYIDDEGCLQMKQHKSDYPYPWMPVKGATFTPPLWDDLVAIYAADFDALYGLRADGTVVTNSPAARDAVISEWTGIVALSATDNVVIGLREDGSVVTTAPHADVSDWKVF